MSSKYYTVTLSGFAWIVCRGRWVETHPYGNITPSG